MMKTIPYAVFVSDCCDLVKCINEDAVGPLGL